VIADTLSAAVLLWPVSQLLAPLVGTAGGLYFGHRLALRAHHAEKRHEFIIEQLREFYTPMLTLRFKIKLNTAECTDLMNCRLSSESFLKHVWPLYQEFAAHFTAHLWLATPDTRKQLKSVLEIIDRESFAFEYGLIDFDDLYSESNQLEHRLTPFYEHIEAKFDELQGRLMPGEGKA
jgi:hypothetical protein